jgi:hypothetical protein
VSRTEKQLLRRYVRAAIPNDSWGHESLANRIGDGLAQDPINLRHALRRQALKHSAGGLQIRRRETFGELIINRCKRCSRLVVATLTHP